MQWDGDPAVPVTWERAFGLFTAYQRSRELADLAEAIDLFERVLPRIPAGHPLHAAVLNNSGIAHRQLFQRTLDTSALQTAVARGRAAVATTPRDHDDYAKRLNNLASALQVQSGVTGDRTSLLEAVEVRRGVVAVTAPGHANEVTRWSNLSTALIDLGRATSDVDVIRDAVDAARTGLSRSPSDDPNRTTVMSTLAIALRELGHRTNSVDAVREAVSLLKDEQALLDPGSHALPTCRHNLCLAFVDLAELTRDGELLDAAVVAARAALDGTAQDDPEWPDRIGSLARCLEALFDRDGVVAVVRERIDCLRQVLDDARTDNPTRDDVLESLSGALRRLHERTGEIDPLEEAVRIGRRAVDGARYDETRARHLALFGPALHQLAMRRGDVVLLREAVTSGRDAVALLAGQPGNRGVAAANTALSVQLLARWTSDATLLPEAMALARDGVHTSVGDLQGRHAHALNALAEVSKRVFEFGGDVSALDEAIDAGRRAAQETAQSDEQRARLLGDLGTWLRTRFEHTGELAALRESIETSRAAVAATSLDHPHRVNHLGHLAGALYRLFERTGDQAASHEALLRAEEAAGSVPDEDPHRSLHLSNLAGFQLGVTRAATDPDTMVDLLSKAMVVSREAESGATPDNVDAHLILYTRSLVLSEFANRTGRREELGQAVDAGRRAVEAAPSGFIHESGYLNSLGRNLEAWFESTGDETSLDEARDVLARAAAAPSASPRDRFRAARAAGEHEMVHRGDPLAALAWFESAVELLPQVVSRGLVRSDRRHELGRLGEFPAAVAACAVASGRAGRAVELLEQCRGLLLAEELDVRSDTDDLRASRPDLAAAFDDVRRQIADAEQAAAGGPAVPAGDAVHGRPSDGDIGARRRELAARWDDTLARIRASPGFERFLRPPPISDLCAQAAGGPVVVVYVGPSRADALVLTADPEHPIDTVRLDRLDRTDAYRQAERLETAVRDGDQNTVHEVLEWLWTVAAGPVTDHLDGVTDGSAPHRLWWCPVGVLASLPFHAAGRHRERSLRRTVLDRAVSSYAITVRSLGHARARPGGPATAGNVVVSMPETPGAPPLIGAGREADRVRRLVEPSVVLEGASATWRSVTEAMTGAAIAHFACHGTSDRVHPNRSALLLDDHGTSPLTVSDLTALVLPAAEFAYLSACSTTETSPSLRDEAVHLTSAVHLAGFRRVVGTLWPIEDAPAVRVATLVYEEMTGGGAHPPAPDRSAHALNAALRAMRDAYPDSPSVWSAHLHVGP